MNEFLRFFPDAGEEAPLAISLAGVTYPDPEYHVSRSSAKVSVIEYVLEGAGWVNLGGIRHRVTADTVYFLPVGEAHDYRSDPQMPFSKIFLNIKGFFCPSLVQAYGLGGQVLFPDAGVREVFERIPPILKSDRPDGDQQAALQGIFTEILARLSRGRQEASFSPEVLAMKHYLDANLHRRVSTGELAAQIFRSADYCEKAFGREMHTTPYAYQLEQKIAKAKALLAYTRTSVGEIGASLGYGDLHYFSNLFYQKVGVRPLYYRKKYR
ncbi:MAG: helix-turn-helix transcriptional regulator [Clostridia bacterium]|nr:helix-turn-helix transcriptional regulator [Clostridia bacterium]